MRWSAHGPRESKGSESASFTKASVESCPVNFTLINIRLLDSDSDSDIDSDSDVITRHHSRVQAGTKEQYSHVRAHLGPSLTPSALVFDAASLRS